MTSKRLRKKKKNDRKDSTTNYRIKKDDVLYSQNICSIFGREKNGSGYTFIKLDYMVDMMIRKGVDAYMIQEYHHEGNGKTCIKGHTICGRTLKYGTDRT